MLGKRPEYVEFKLDVRFKSNGKGSSAGRETTSGPQSLRMRACYRFLASQSCRQFLDSAAIKILSCTAKKPSGTLGKITENYIKRLSIKQLRRACHMGLGNSTFSIASNVELS
ncbi:hypothetical protein ACU8KH_02082 [Lachancea thermotolerans]